MRKYAVSLVALAVASIHCGGRIGLATGSSVDPPDAGTPPAPLIDASPGDAASVCVDVQSDSHNCDRCGRDCQGGACVAGVCQPVALATGEDYPVSIAVDQGHVYWINWTDPDLDPHPNTTTVRSIAKAGGDVTTLGTTAPFAPTSLHVDDKALYFYRAMMNGTPVGGAGVMRVCKDGSCPLERIFGPAEDNFVPLAMDSDAIFFHDEEWDAQARWSGVVRIDKDGGHETILALDEAETGGMYDLVADDRYVFAMVNDSLVRVAKDGSSVSGGATSLGTGLTSGGEQGDLALDALNVFAVASDRIVRIRKDGSETATLAPIEAPAYVVTLALDDARLYWLEWAKSGERGTVLRAVDKQGGGAISSVTIGAAASSGSLSVDDTCVYWVGTTGDRFHGSIMKMVKPL